MRCTMKEKNFNATMKKYFSEQVEVAVPPAIVKQPPIRVPRGQVFGVVGAFAATAMTFWAAKEIGKNKSNVSTDEVIFKPRQT